MITSRKSILFVLLMVMISATSFKLQQASGELDGASPFLDMVISKGAENGLKLVSYTKYADIKSDADIKDIIPKLIDGEIVYLPVNNQAPSELKVITLKEASAREAEKENNAASLQEKWEKGVVPVLKQKVEVGSEVYKLKWELDGKTFSTLCVLNADNFIYDSMLVNMMSFKEKAINGSVEK